MPKPTEIEFSTFIQRPIEEAFQFATTPANWVYWHPATIWVEGDIHHSGKPNDRILEGVKIGLFRGEILWTVKENRHLKQWAFEGFTDLPLNKGLRPTITYRFMPQDGGTLFTRHLIYTPPTAFNRFLNHLMIKWSNRSQSRRAVKNLKKVLEAPTLPHTMKREGSRIVKITKEFESFFTQK